MGIFRARWLKKALAFLFLFLLCAAPFGPFDPREKERVAEDYYLCAVKYHAVLKARPPLKIKYGINLALQPKITVSVEVIASPCDERPSDRPTANNRGTNRYRGPPRLSYAA